jgi:hypothetical protein
MDQKSTLILGQPVPLMNRETRMSFKERWLSFLFPTRPLEPLLEEDRRSTVGYHDRMSRHETGGMRSGYLFWSNYRNEEDR